MQRHLNNTIEQAAADLDDHFEEIDSLIVNELEELRQENLFLTEMVDKAQRGMILG